MREEHIRLLQAGAKTLDTDGLSDASAQIFMRYMALLSEWNAKINLTAITTPRDVVIKHFLDSLTVLDMMPKACGLRVIDVGTGAGFPGLPLKIARPDLSLTLLDSLNKRVHFLRTVSDALSLGDVTCLHARAEEAGQNAAWRQSYDIAVARAVAHLGILAEYCLPFVKTGGQFIAMKGSGANEEIKDAKAVVAALGGEISDIKAIKLPFTDITHTLIIVSKLSDTPPKFPRKPNKIAKKPLI